jgi:hypothetical protein
MITFSTLLQTTSLVLVAPLAAYASTSVESSDVAGQIAELREEIAQLKQENNEGWLTEQRSAEIRGVVQDVLADADTRASFQDSAATAGWKKGFFLASPDGNFSLKVGGQLQVRYVLNSRKGDQKLGPLNPPNTQWGFENRRTKLSFSGNVFDKSWTYKIKGAFSRSGGDFVLEDGYVQKKFDGGLAIKVGQFKAPWMREELVSSSKQLTVERSIVNEYFNQGYSQGIQLGYEADSFRAWAWAGDGIGSRGFGPARFNSRNTNWDQTATSYAFAGRAEYKISGDWSQFKDFSSKRGSGSGMMAGLSAVTQRANENLSAKANGTKVYGVTGDFTWDMSGASLFVSGVWTNVDSPTGDDSNPWGVTIQGGYFVTESVEAFVRYEYMDFDPSIRTNIAKYDGFTVGGNWFINSSVRFSADFSYNFSSLDSGAFVASGAGFRADEPGENGQWAARAQLQLLF